MLGFVVLMVFSSMLHDISSIDEVFPTLQDKIIATMLAMCNLCMKLGLRWRFQLLMVMLMVLMNIILLKHTWKTCGNKDKVGNWITAIRSHGHSLR